MDGRLVVVVESDSLVAVPTRLRGRYFFGWVLAGNVGTVPGSSGPRGVELK